MALSHGWTLDGIDTVELHAVEDLAGASDTQTMFHPIEIDLDAFTAPLRESIRRTKPRRAVIDSLSELRVLAQDQRRFRRQIMAMKEAFLALGCTLLVLDDRSPEEVELVPQTFAHGVLVLRFEPRGFGPPRRWLSVVKLRGARIREGHHDVRVVTGGVRVYPRVVAAEHRAEFRPTTVSSGAPGLDAMLGGGLTRGTSAIITGPAGAGKSVFLTQYLVSAARRGEPAAAYLFEESRESFLTRAAGAGMDLCPHLAAGLVRIEAIDPAELAPGEFAQLLCDDVKQRGVRVVGIDSLNGYLCSVPGEEFLLLHLHELLTALGQLGAVTLLTLSQHGIVGPPLANVDVSYLCDAMILLRFFEALGEMRKCVSVPKLRSGRHELTIREYRIANDGLHFGEPVHDFQGVLTGTPTYVGEHEPPAPPGSGTHRAA